MAQTSETQPTLIRSAGIIPVETTLEEALSQLDPTEPVIGFRYLLGQHYQWGRPDPLNQYAWLYTRPQETISKEQLERGSIKKIDAAVVLGRVDGVIGE